MSGLLSTLFGIGPQKSSTGTTPTAPPTTEAAREELISRTRGFAAEPFQPYVDAQGRAIPRVAEFTPDQQRAFESTRGLATQAGGLSALTPELAQQSIAATRGCRYYAARDQHSSVHVAVHAGRHRSDDSRHRRTRSPRASTSRPASRTHRLLRRFPPSHRRI